MFKSINRDDKYGIFGLLFTIPFFILLLIFTASPLVYTIFISFNKWDGVGEKTFIGLANFTRLVGDPRFYNDIGNTWIIWLQSVLPQMIVGLILAVILTDRNLKGKDLLRGLYYLPNLVTMTSVGALFLFILDWQTGSLNKILIGLGILSEPYEYLQDITATRLSISFTLFWMWFGYSMIIYMAGIKSISEDLYEAAFIDGATKSQVFWKITLPMLRPIVLYQVVTSVIGGLSMFDIPYVLTNGVGSPQGSCETIVMYVYNMVYRNNNYGYGAAIGVGAILHILIFVVIAFKFINREESTSH